MTMVSGEEIEMLVTLALVATGIALAMMVGRTRHWHGHR
jgi:hypothetical protein